MQNFQNKVVVITGAGSGIGKELARQFANEGARLALNDWNQDSLSAIWNELPKAAQGYMHAFDVINRQSVDNFPSSARASLARIDVSIKPAENTQHLTPTRYAAG